MKNWLSMRAALALVLAAALMALAAPAHAEKRVALVIGNNDYKNVPKLQKAVNDARTMGATPVSYTHLARSISESVSSPGFSMETPTEMVTRPRISPVDFFFSSFAITARRM